MGELLSSCSTWQLSRASGCTCVIQDGTRWILLGVAQQGSYVFALNCRIGMGLRFGTTTSVLMESQQKTLLLSDNMHPTACITKVSLAVPPSLSWYSEESCAIRDLMKSPVNLSPVTSIGGDVFPVRFWLSAELDMMQWGLSYLKSSCWSRIRPRKRHQGGFF